MCGICGQVRWDGGSPSEALLSSMCAAQEHRGPDSRGIHVDARAGLGIQRLRVIDLETGDQPIFNEDRSVAVVLNGEIYNFRELRARLRRSGHRFATEGDTEVIAHLYEEEGPGFVSSLEGMFGLAVWDARRQRLVLARDRVGKKPLFYALRDGTLSFASELRALLQDPGISRTIDLEAIDAYLALRWIPAPLSAFEAVRKLPPASILVLEEGLARIERYWSLDYNRPPESTDEREIAERLREELRAAVGKRMISDVPLGAFLSGGIDSSAVVAAMAEQSSEPVRTFSIGFDEKRYDELAQARLVAERFGTEHEELVVAPDAIEILPRIVGHYGEPFADSSAIPSFYLAEMARRSVTVALNGDGGDESFGGYSRYVANLALNRAARLPGPLLESAARLEQALPSSGRIDSPRSRLGRVTRAAGLEPAARHASYLTQLDVAERRALYTDELRARLDGTDAAGAAIAARWAESSAREPLDRMLDVDVGLYLPDDLLTKIDIATMAHSLEGRSPLLDHRLMEFAASLPARMKVRNGQKKVALRAALRGWVPDAVLDAPKQGFVVPMAEWLRGDLRELAYETLLDATAVDRGHFRPDAVRSLLDRHVSGTEDRSRAIWALLVLELWQREVASMAPSAGSASALPVAVGSNSKREAQKSSEPAGVTEEGTNHDCERDEPVMETTAPARPGEDGTSGDGVASRLPLPEDPNLSTQVGVFEAMRLYWWLVAAPVILLVGVAIALGFLRSPVYTATTSLSIDFGAESPTSLPGSVSAAQGLADSYARAIEATPVVHAVAGGSGYSEQDVPDHVSATPIPESTIVKVSGSADSDRAAIALTNLAGASLSRYIGTLNKSRRGSAPILSQYQQAEVVYQDRLDHQLELADAAAANPSDEALDLELKRAKVQTQVAELQRQSLASAYQTSQQVYVAPLTFLSKATSSSSDRNSKLEFFIFVGLLAGLAVGAALATINANRF
jgi:asparagine synthase (glutamine-hydrolysing)